MVFFGIFKKRQPLVVDDIKAKDENKLDLALRRLEVARHGIEETETMIRQYMRDFRTTIHN